MSESTVNTDVKRDEIQTANDQAGDEVNAPNPIDNDDQSGNTPDKSAMIPKYRFDQILQQKKDAIEALENVANSLACEVPEEMQDIIPDLPAQQKIEWIRNANKKGLFNKQVESGLDSKRPAGKPALNLEKMQPEQLFKAGYKS